LKVTVNSRNYEVAPLPPYAAPFASMIAKLGSEEVATIDDARKRSAEIKELLQEIMKECVSPEPNPQDVTELYRYISGLTAKSLSEVDKIFFPNTPPVQADTKRSGGSTR